MHKFSTNAARRYGRALKWIEEEGCDDKKSKLKKAEVQKNLAKAYTLGHRRFGENQRAASDAEKKAINDALALLKEVAATGESQGSASLKIDGLKMTLQVLIQAEDTKEARVILEQLQGFCPGDTELVDDSARLHRLETALSLNKGAGTVEVLQTELRAANETKDIDAAKKVIAEVLALMKNNQVKFDVINKMKLGKDIGNAMKLGDPELSVEARRCIGEIQRLAQQGALGL